MAGYKSQSLGEVTMQHFAVMLHSFDGLWQRSAADD
jgi:hypothetical protein